MYTLSLVLALISVFCFASASLLFTHFSHRTSVYWMNMFKACISTLGCGVAILFLESWDFQSGNLFFIASGVIGLMIGDIFLLRAFTTLGPGRSLILFGFQPLVMAMAGYFLFSQEVYLGQFLAIFFLIGCLVVFSLENRRLYQTWGIKGLVFAIIGVLLDSTGLILTKYGFETTDAHFFQANFLRSAAAFLGFVILGRFMRISFVKSFRSFSLKDRSLVTLGSFCGTFLSLSIYMAAIEIGHLASISAIVVTGPFIASTLECLLQKKAPSRYLMAAFVFFLIGFYLLVERNFSS